MPLNESINNTQFDPEFQPPRCTHELMSGETCGQPALRGQQVCRFHREMRPRPEFVLPEIEDAASLQLALNRIMRALADGLLAPKQASLLLYGLQIASINLRRLADERKPRRKTSPEDEPRQQGRKSQNQEQHEPNPEDETSLLRLLLEKLQLPLTPEEVAAGYSLDDDGNKCDPEGRPVDPAPPGPSANDQRRASGEYQPEAPDHSARVNNIKACADPAIGNRYSTTGNRNYKKPITRNRKRKIANHNSQITNDPRDPAAWKM